MSDVDATIGPHRMSGRPKLWVMFLRLRRSLYGGLFN